MGVEQVVIEGAEVAEVVAPGISERLFAEVAHAMPALGRFLRKESMAPAAQVGKLPPALSLIQESEHAAATMRAGFTRTASQAGSRSSGFESYGAAILEHPALPPMGFSKGASSMGLPEASRLPRATTEEEDEAYLDRMAKMLDNPAIGLPPSELINQGLGARLWQFGTAGGDVLRQRVAPQVTGRWSAELAGSREWLQQNPQALTRFPALSEKAAAGRVQLVHQGESTQFAAGPLSVPLRTDNVATCAAVHCIDGARQFLGHADTMIHHRALTEALHAAGIDLNKAEVTLMPGPLPSPVLENILPTFMDNAKAMSRLKIIPFRGPAHGSVIARDGGLFVP